MSDTQQLMELLEAAADGNQLAFRRLYTHTSAKLFGVVLRIVVRRDLAEEILQEAYLRIWDHAGDYESRKGSPMTWMITIARNRALDWRRSRKAEVSLDDRPERESPAAGDYGSYDRMFAHQDVLDLERCLEELEDQQKDCILLAYCEGYTHQELANRLERPVGTVKSWIRRGQISLKQCLDQ